MQVPQPKDADAERQRAYDHRVQMHRCQGTRQIAQLLHDTARYGLHAQIWIKLKRDDDDADT